MDMIAEGFPISGGSDWKLPISVQADVKSRLYAAPNLLHQSRVKFRNPAFNEVQFRSGLWVDNYV